MNNNDSSASHPAHLKLILLLVCLTYFCNCFFLHIFRTGAVFFAPSLRFHPTEAHKFSRVMSFLYVPTIFLGVFAGRITDTLSAELSLVLFSLLSCSSIFVLFLFVRLRLHVGGLFVAMFFYGTGQNLSKIPMQKITALLFQGNHLAFAINIVQLFSHLAGIAASRLSVYLLHTYGVPQLFLVVFFVSAMSFPLCLLLLALVNLGESVRVVVKKVVPVSTLEQETLKSLEVGKTKRIALVEKQYRQSLRTCERLKLLRKKHTSFAEAFSMLFFETEKVFFVALAMALLVDGCQVSFKNIESFVLKDIFAYGDAEVARVLSWMKIFNLLTPLSSVLVDRFRVRHVYFVVSTGLVLLCHLFFFACIRKTFVPNKLIVVFVGSVLRLVFSLFHAAFYSFVAVILQRKIKGFGFGLVYSVLAVGYVIMPMVYARMHIEAERVFIGMFVLGFLLSLVLFMMNYNRNVLNKDKRL